MLRTVLLDPHIAQGSFCLLPNVEQIKEMRSRFHVEAQKNHCRSKSVEQKELRLLKYKVDVEDVR